MKTINKLNLMYVKMMFLGCALLEVNDELQATNVYRHRLKKLSNELMAELEKVSGKDLTVLHQKDEDSSFQASKAIYDIAGFIAQGTMNDWLHIRNWLIEYFEKPDVERIMNKATIEPLRKFKANDIIIPDKDER